MTQAIAFYLPQYHPIPVNDAWWGEGFTEWQNVVEAQPLFRGHEQPRLPGELGFYDLRVTEVRERQAELAREYGITAFCYFHYWFGGRRLLERPFDEVLASGRPDFRFCLCWANEPWTRAWDGRSGEILVEQRYSEEDDRRHIRWLVEAFRDERYVRIDGRPLFLVYRAADLPDPLATTRRWREEARRAGIELFLARVESFRGERGDPAAIGFDAAVEFQPDWSNLPRPLRRGRLWDVLGRFGLWSSAYRQHTVADYAELVEKALAKPRPEYLRFPCVTPSWDNSPRRRSGGAFIATGSTPELFERWLTEVVRRATRTHGADPIVFINAWNEWAEGNVLEPSARWGRAYLEATRRVASEEGRRTGRARRALVEEPAEEAAKMPSSQASASAAARDARG
jgi:lipopolysaccharide biosynthesis protein